MTSPLGPTPAEAGRNLLDFLRRNPARHRAIAAVALALVAGATIGRVCDPLRLHALVIASLITALLVLSDLFVQPAQLVEGRAPARRTAWLSIPARPPADADRPLPCCPTCGLPVFAHADDAPTLFSGLSWRQGPATHVTLFPFATGRVHANDDSDPDTSGLKLRAFGEERAGHDQGIGPAGVSPLGTEPMGAAPGGRAEAAADPSTAPEMVGRPQAPLTTPSRATYAGSRLKTALDMIGAGALLVALAPLMLAIACLLAISGGRPVLVHQDRLDWSGGCFRVSRFRSDSACLLDARGLPAFRSGGPRAVGPQAASRSAPSMALKLEAFLHRSGLASLPLLLSVLRGDLSFVGPDPAMPKMSRRDRVGAAIVAEFASRLGARPGLTGWAEVNTIQARGRAITARQKIACDLYYLEHGSPLLDLRILARALDALASKDRA